MANEPSKDAVNMTMVCTVAEPFGIPGLKSTGKPMIPVPDCVAPYLAAIGWFGESDKAAAESTIVERDGKQMNKWGKPELNVSYFSKWFESLKIQKEKPKAKGEKKGEKEGALHSPAYKVCRDNGYTGYCNRTETDIFKIYQKRIGEMGYGLEVSDGPFKSPESGKLCNGYHFGKKKKIKVNGEVEDAELVYEIAHEFWHAKLGEDATEAAVHRCAISDLYKLGASRKVTEAAERMFRNSETVRRAA